MKKSFFIFLLSLIILGGCVEGAARKEAKVAEKQQNQYAIGQPIPAYDWSLERHLIIELYNVRNKKVLTHSVWRSDLGQIEGDCPSLGYGLPYDTSLTNPLTAADFGSSGTYDRHIVEQAEPNGIFASKNTAATWVLCVGQSGAIEPVYVETKVTVYPGPVKLSYTTNRVLRSGKATVTIAKE